MFCLVGGVWLGGEEVSRGVMGERRKVKSNKLGGGGGEGEGEGEGE